MEIKWIASWNIIRMESPADAYGNWKSKFIKIRGRWIKTYDCAFFKLAFDAILRGQLKEMVVGRYWANSKNIEEIFWQETHTHTECVGERSFNVQTFSAQFLLVNCKWDIVFACSTLWPYNDSNSKHVKIDCERMHHFLVPLNKSCTYHSMYPPLPWHGTFSPSIRRRWLQHR